MAQAGPEIIGGNNGSGFTLYRFHDDGCNVVAYFASDVQLLFNCVGIAIWHVKDAVVQGHSRPAEGGLSGQGERAGSFSVEAAYRGNKSAFARVQPGELHSAFDGLCAAANKKAVL